MKIGIFQPDIKNYHSLEQKFSQLKKILISNSSLDVLVLPELFLSSYSSNDQITQYSSEDIQVFEQSILSLSSEHQCSIIYGYPEIKNDKRYNSALVTNLDNTVLYNHRKTLLAPNTMEQELFIPGKGFDTFLLGDIKCSVLICYEFEFPEIVRKISQMGAQIVFIPTALGVDFEFVANEMLKTRAFENQIILVYANYCGNSHDHNFLGKSAIVNEKGQDLLRFVDKEDFLAVDVEFKDQKTRRDRLPYLKDLSKVEV